MNEFTCGSCDSTAAELDGAIDHAASTGHSLTRTIDDEGTTLTISAVHFGAVDVDEDPYDEDDDWNAADQ